jgi:hypothetical protein
MNQELAFFAECFKFWHTRCFLQARSATSRTREDAMQSILIFGTKWIKWYGVLRRYKGFGVFASMRYGVWLARG